ncbi:lipopolysaccharide assembly LapA domain-containing protein [Chitinimonas sp. BJYL2]|uniref:LapA family protein n=1 Tax=Chitinimonas sp. BJYL2 TaxID=2976696 RepID=UPI0022B3B92F|nr:LapA family protein [Chitinimonas sp. BJYL2]
MRYLIWLAKLAVFLILFAFALRNTGHVTLSGLQGAQWQAPLILWLLLFFVLGVIAGVVAMWLPYRRLDRELRHIRAQQPAAAAAAEPALPDAAQPLDAVI